MGQTETLCIKSQYNTIKKTAVSIRITHVGVFPDTAREDRKDSGKLKRNRKEKEMSEQQKGINKSPSFLPPMYNNHSSLSHYS